MVTAARHGRGVTMRRIMPKNRVPSRALYGTLPRDVMRHPPVQAWRPFDIAIACALSVKARFERARQRHIKALDIGATTIDQEKHYAELFQEDWKKVKARRRRGEQDVDAPERFHAYKGSEYKPLAYADELRKAGKTGYRRAQRALRKGSPPEVIEIELSRAALLRLAHLSTDAKNRAELDAALARLQKPLRVDGVRKSGLLESIDEKAGKLRLRIRGEWLEPPFGQIPLPLPTRSPAATALYLFLHTVRTSRSNTRAINSEDLCRRLGIDTDRPPFVLRQALHRALDLVNQYVRRLNETDLDRHGVTAIDHYNINAVNDGRRLRFVGVRHLIEEKECEASDDFAGRKRVMPRPGRSLAPVPMHDPRRKQLWAEWEKGDRIAAMRLGVPAKQ